jgi:penicillin amidase
MQPHISLIKTMLLLISRSRLPRIKGETHLPGLNAPVEILRDSWGTPHIYAQDLHDLFFAQGYVHAQDRMWQMDFNRRLVAGRLSEILGAVGLPLDRWMRTLTMRRVAEFEVGLLDGEIKGFLQAYADGINVFIGQRRFPIEFTLLKYKPEPWIVADTLAWIKMMSWDLSVNWEAEILRSRLLSHLGPELAAELELPHLKRWPYIVPPGSDYSHIGTTATKRANAARPFTGPSPYEGLGSNNWALSGTRTVSGKPLLANDMHLSISAPSIWFENHLVAENINAIGIIFPGIPGIIAGHNGHVAWGFTNGFPDVQDLYMERLRRDSNGDVLVEYNGNWEKARVLKETIAVKGENPVTEEVIITRHGPIINALAPDFAGEQPLALRWTSLEPDTMIHGVFEMLNAVDCKEFHRALRHWTAPTQNVVYADISGNIAYTFPGKIPIRAKGDGRFPVPGWNDEYEWLGYIPYEGLPHLENPPQGYVVTANNQTISDDYPVRIDLEPIPGDRAQRIAEMILNSRLRNGEERIDIPFIEKMQFDQLSPSARIIARYIGRLHPDRSANHPSTELDEVIRLFKEWDGTLAADNPVAAIYQVFIRKMIRSMFADKLETSEVSASPEQSPHPSPEEKPVNLIDRFMGKGPTPVLAETGLSGERWLPWLTNLFEDPDSHWFDLGHGEKRDDVFRLALQASIDELKEILGPHIKDWSWGEIHKLTFNHPLAGGGKLLEALFNRGPFPIGGDQTTIWATGSGCHDLETSSIVGPPYRMIVDLNDLNNSISISAPGQSGNPGSSHYDDQIKPWFQKEYHPMLYARVEIEENANNRLVLIPK